MIARDHGPSNAMQQKRVAIYCRVSTEDQANKEYSSLDAQRQSCLDFIHAHKHEGWVPVAREYVDGGFTGSNMDRPALMQLFEDVRSDRVDIVCIYKLDRISRRQIDLLNIVKMLEDHRVGFVCVTQPFDTNNPMGKFILQMLGAFAELEREVIRERTRDKIRSARKLGRYTGGRPTLGYNNIDGKLVVNEAEAARVRAIFELYLQLGSLGALVAELNSRGWTLKNYKTREGKDVVGGAFTRTNLQYFLRNAVFAGKQRCGGELVAGQHAAIVNDELFDAVQKALAAKARGMGGATTPNVLLRGLLVCGKCSKGWTHHVTSKKGGRSNVYYECSTYQKRGAAACPGSRASAAKLEADIVAAIADRLRRKPVLRDTLRAARESVATRTSDLERELKRLRRERGRLTGDVPSEITAQIAAAEAELEILASLQPDERELAKCFDDFDALWAETFPAERARLLQLLIAKITIDADAGNYQITFRDDARNAREIEEVA